jgi:hypothetical protein
VTRYTHRRHEPTIGVSCGHRVPRVPVPRTDGKTGNVYWCEVCGTHKMSGGRCTGERGFDFLLDLRDEVIRLGVTVPDPGTEQGRAVVAALGGRVA